MNKKFKVGDVVTLTNKDYRDWLFRSGLSTTGTIIKVDGFWLNGWVYTVEFSDQGASLPYKEEDLRLA